MNRAKRDLLSVQLFMLCVCKTERTHAGVALNMILYITLLIINISTIIIIQIVKYSHVNHIIISTYYNLEHRTMIIANISSQRWRLKVVEGEGTCHPL